VTLQKHPTPDTHTKEAVTSHGDGTPHQTQGHVSVRRTHCHVQRLPKVPAACTRTPTTTLAKPACYQVVKQAVDWQLSIATAPSCAALTQQGTPQPPASNTQHQHSLVKTQLRHSCFPAPMLLRLLPPSTPAPPSPCPNNHTPHHYNTTPTSHTHSLTVAAPQGQVAPHPCTPPRPPPHTG
jgi:hypothetical protein